MGYGDNFFFMDLYNDGILDGFNDNDVYLEWYPNFSFGKILGRRVGFGRIRDVGVLAGINYDAGKTLFGCPDKLFVGVEWQIWINKFGDSRTDENTVQALVVWRF